MNAQAQFAGQIIMTLASIFPLSERSAINVLGVFNVDNVVKFETLDDWYKTNSNGDDNSGKKKTGALNYDFYKTFWSVQNNFTDPSTLLPKEVSNNIDGEWNKKIGVFVNNVELVLGAFESNSFPNRLVKDLKYM